ncbi:concanavalin A-like lectin/glucanase domain-containing protein [Diplogelasinospora grovesii]|uniref:Concanavalin A-like lectin/glucanase domain-containing protein n=1 Tax=Diplogelasinospora grovesii TaxID=303347 RepID=A0AAN6N377_9PEZI|nr:concanavalin A-like lectin/glucanase domain-containing protein [Diplogelasinospora grovesii]
MRLSRSSIAVLVSSFLAWAEAQYLQNDLSFGYGVRISPEGSTSVPNFSLQGRPNIPEVLSNKIILTAPAPGNQRGAIWADKQLQQQSWIADVDFRVNGPERGGGNLNIWLVRDGAHNVGSGSIYTVGRFEGLALVVDQHGGSGGMIRGFLNDGTTDYKSHHNVDNLAFGHCQYPYRNLGRPTQIKIRHTETNFRVEIDSHLCFESDKVRIPGGYSFGVTAASAENPDSFEVFKLVVLTEEYQGGSNDNSYNQYQEQRQQQPIGGSSEGGNEAPERPHVRYGRQGMVVPGQQMPEDPFDKEMPDQEADKIVSSKAQFADLHNRLQSVNHHLSTVFRQVAQHATIGEQRHEELSIMLGEMKGLLTKLDKITDLEQRLYSMEKQMNAVRQELTARLKDSENSIKYHVSDKHESLADHVKTHAAPGHTRLILVIVGSQLLLVGAYFYYKRRKSTPKKYL